MLRYAELMVLAMVAVIAKKVIVIDAKCEFGLTTSHFLFVLQEFASATRVFTDLIVKTMETVRNHAPTEGNV
jgi:hypothetical protein